MPVGMPLGQAMRVQEAQQASELAKSLYDFNSDDNSDAEGCSAMPEKNTSTAGKKPRLEQQLRRYKRSWGRGRVPGRQGTSHDFIRRFTFACFHFMQARSSTHHGRKGLTRRTIKTTRRSNTKNRMKKRNCDASFAWHRMLSVARSSVPHAPRYVKHAMCRCMSDTVMKSITIPTPAGSWI